MATADRRPATLVIKNEVGHASDLVARALMVPERALVICLERVRLAEDEPIALMRNFLPAALVHLSTETLAEHGLYELLRASGIRLGSATQRISAKNATTAEARILHETRGSALLTMERIAYDDGGRPVEFGQRLYRPSRYAPTITMPRTAPAQGAPGNP
ncbi:MAG TPA: UTRA domain-containing protein [Streptosporangiaceae bacterium]|nr:UTRA domain-containing protein [Streptosporangiaceae bacterium]